MFNDLTAALHGDNGLGVLVFVGFMALVVGFDKLAAWNRARRRSRRNNAPR